jgi:hypothetical protein
MKFSADGRAGNSGAGNSRPRSREHHHLGVAVTSVVALATAAACVIGTTAAASAASTRRQHSFGAAAGTAVDRAAAGLPGSQSTLADGQVGTRSQVPWRLIGPGWTLAEFTTGSDRAARPVTLYMTDPAGGRYRMYRWAASQAPWQLIAWSGDKRRALIEQPGGKRPIMHQLALATGQVTTFRLPSAAATALSYTEPNGENILIANHGIARYSLAGTIQARLISGSEYNSVLSSASGLTEVVNGNTGVELVSNAGGLIRRLPVPGASAKLGGCLPVRWWSSGVALVSCTANTVIFAPRLWLVPVSGAAPAALTRLRNGHGPDYGDLDAWRLPSGLYVEALGGCGTRFIGKQAANGTVRVINVRGSSGNNVVVATSGNRMLVREFSECFPSSSLVWFNPATGSVRNALIAPAGGDGVLSVVAYDRNGQQPGNLP